MNQVRNISVVGNIILAILVIWLVQRRPAPQHHPVAAGEAKVNNAPPETQAAPSAAAAPNVEPFRWSQLESTDYRVYVANLRKVGCPEQTIRDILTADLDSAYAPRRAQFERSLTAGFAARHEAETGLRELRSEEAYLLATLLGDALPAAQAAANTPPWVLARRNARPVVPLVFGNIDPAALQLDRAQVAVINQVRQKFQQEVGAQDPQDPNDPAYRQRWDMAQRAADDRLRGMLGSKVYIQCQVQAANHMARGEKSE